MSRRSVPACTAIGVRFACAPTCIVARANAPVWCLGSIAAAHVSAWPFVCRGDLRDEVITYLRERELVTNVYLERKHMVRLDAGGTVEAICYVVDRAHEQYAGNLHEAEAATIVSGAVGQSGRNEEYVLSTLEHLEALGIRDHWLEDVAKRITKP